MKLLWKVTAAAVIGWTGSVAFDKFQEWGITPGCPSVDSMTQYWQDLWYGKAEPEAPDPWLDAKELFKTQIEARKQQAVERDIKGKALRVVTYLPSFTTMRHYTKPTQHGVLTIRCFVGKVDKLLVFWDKPGISDKVLLELVFGWSQSKGQKPLITVYRPGDWEKVLDEIQPEAIAAEKAELERREPTAEDLVKKNWGL